MLRRRQNPTRILAIIALLLAVSAAAPLRVSTIAAQDAPLVRAVDAVGFAVSDMDRAAASHRGPSPHYMT